MIEDAINKILSLDTTITTKEINGALYSKNALYHILPPELATPDPVKLSTLHGLVDFVLCNKDDITDSPIIKISSHDTVDVITDIIKGTQNKRFKLATAKAAPKVFGFDSYYELEEFIVAIQSQFVETQLSKDILAYLGNVVSEHIKEDKDDGFSQSITIETGLSSKARVQIKNPLTLKPYRTFPEIDQPESPFVLRLKERQGLPLQVALFKCDNGLWELVAKKLIADELIKLLDGSNVRLIW